MLEPGGQQRAERGGDPEGEQPERHHGRAGARQGCTHGHECEQQGDVGGPGRAGDRYQRPDQVQRGVHGNAGEDPAVNEEWNCDKGRFAFRYVNANARLTTPLVRRDGELQP
ncbi:hypothetical protein E4P38_09860, partial [Blastococcus sp. CT_GayMR16]